jgi:putative nucleotidyltransferase with HDIG domain
MGIPLRVLMIEDSEDDALLLLRELRNAGYDPVCERVETPAEMDAALQGRTWDVIFSDHSLPHFSTPGAMALLKDKGLDIPFIIVSGSIGEEMAVSLMKAGAHDYLRKDNLSRLVPAIRREMGEAEVRRQRKQAEEALQQSYRKLRRVLEETAVALASAIEKRDPYTAGHQERVAQLASAIAKAMSFSEEQIEGIRVAGVLHDIGKISVPAEILSKPARLTQVEFAIIKTHPQVGYEIVKDIEFPWPVAQMTLQHHERMDGGGYPSGLRGEQILLEARILGVADVVEAISSHRPYRPALGIDKAKEEIVQKRGALYDPAVVDAVLSVLAQELTTIGWTP